MVLAARCRSLPVGVVLVTYNHPNRDLPGYLRSGLNDGPRLGIDRARTQ